MGLISEIIAENQRKKELKWFMKIKNTRKYYDVFGDELEGSEAQMSFLLRNFEMDILIRMFKGKPAYILYDDQYIEIFFAHSLTTTDMCIVMNDTQYETWDQDYQAAIILDAAGNLIDTYRGSMKYDRNSEDQTILI